MIDGRKHIIGHSPEVQNLRPGESHYCFTVFDELPDEPGQHKHASKQDEKTADSHSQILPKEN